MNPPSSRFRRRRRSFLRLNQEGSHASPCRFDLCDVYPIKQVKDSFPVLLLDKTVTTVPTERRLTRVQTVPSASAMRSPSRVVLTSRTPCLRQWARASRPPSVSYANILSPSPFH